MTLERDQLKQQLSESTEQNKSLEDRVRSLMIELAKANQANQQLESTNAKLTEELQLINDQQQAVQNIKVQISNENSDYQHEIENYKDMIDKLKEELMRSNQEIKEKDVRIETISEQTKEDSTKQVFEQKMTIMMLEEQNDKLNKYVNELNNEKNQLDQQVNVLRNQVESEIQQTEGQNIDELRNDLQHTKQELQEQIEKFEKLDLLTRKLKQENRILEKFMTIEMRSPQDIMDEFRTGMMTERQFLSGYQTDANNSPKSPIIRKVSRFNLSFETNIY